MKITPTPEQLKAIADHAQALCGEAKARGFGYSAEAVALCHWPAIAAVVLERAAAEVSLMRLHERELWDDKASVGEIIDAAIARIRAMKP